MEGFTNLRTKEFPGIGITERDIDLMLEVMRKMMERYNGWPKKGTWRILWQEEGCEAREILGCNFAEGVSKYSYHFSHGRASGGSDYDTDRIVDDAMRHALERKWIDPGIHSNWWDEGVEDVLVLNMMEGRILISINATEKFIVEDGRFKAAGSEEHLRVHALMIGVAEVLNEILSADALYRFVVTGDMVLQKSMQAIRQRMTSAEKEVVSFVNELLAAREVPEAEKERWQRLEEVKLEIIRLREERLSGSVKQ